MLTAHKGIDTDMEQVGHNGELGRAELDTARAFLGNGRSGTSESVGYVLLREAIEAHQLTDSPTYCHAV